MPDKKEQQPEMEKRAVVLSEKEKRAHEQGAKKAGQDPDPQPRKK